MWQQTTKLLTIGYMYGTLLIRNLSEERDMIHTKVACPSCKADNARLPDGTLPRFCMFCAADMVALWKSENRRTVMLCDNTKCRFEWDPKKMGKIPEGLTYCPKCGKRLTTIPRDEENSPWKEEDPEYLGFQPGYRGQE